MLHFADGDGAMNEGYRKWRARIPFTDEEIARALDAEADWRASAVQGNWLREVARRCRAGWVSAKALSEALPRLVTVCALCPKKALYRMGSEGRCAAHRLVQSAGMQARQARLNSRGEETQAVRKAHDYRDLAGRPRQRAHRPKA